ncbi:hypothetical protein GCM10027289_16190 [Tsukamurella serpentis]
MQQQPQDSTDDRSVRITGIRRQVGDVDAIHALRKIARAIVAMARQDTDDKSPEAPGHEETR